MSSSRERALVVEPRCLDDLRYWTEVDPRVAARIYSLLESVMRDPASGIGKPERLRHVRPNTWSRRITQEHRLVYQVLEDRVLFIQAREHY